MPGYTPSERSQRFVKRIYGDELLAGELRWLAIRQEKAEMLAEARKLWPNERNVGKLVRMYCIAKGKVNLPLITRKARMISVKAATAVDRRREKLIKAVSGGYGEVPTVKPAVMTDSEKEAYLRSHSEISRKIPKVPCPKCKGLMTLGPICGSCMEARAPGGNRYRTKWVCTSCGYSRRSTRSLGSWAKELGKEGGQIDYDVTTVEGQ